MVGRTTGPDEPNSAKPKGPLLAPVLAHRAASPSQPLRKVDMLKLYSPLQFLAMGLGGALLALQTWLLYEHAAHAASLSPALLAAVPVVTVTLAALPILMEHCLRSRSWLKALGLLILFGLLVGYSLPQAIGRAGEARDAKIAEAIASTRPLELVTEELKRTLTRIDDAEREMKAECKSGFGRKCEGWKRTLAERQASAKALRDDIAKLAPPKVGASDTPRIAAVLGISEATVNLYQPLFLPLAMELGVWVLLWIG
ncbi:MAG TPA: hypothetical protein PK264_18890, partial [Hyphomicrobiaceae bacterium]|nr:hypothetical protein [Hyphomicrobiaceae bacterium]